MVRVLLPLSKLLDEQVVTKRTGEKRYVVKSKITVHGFKNIILNGRKPAPKQEIKAQPGTKFLISEDGLHINAVPDTMEVLAELDSTDLYELYMEMSGATNE